MMPSKLRFEISHARFCFVFCTVLFASCNAVNVDRLAKWFYGKEGLDTFALSAYLLVGLGLFIAFFTLLAHRYSIKPLALVLLFASTAATYFIAKYGVAIDGTMMVNTAHTDPTEVGQLLSWQMLPYVLGLLLLPSLAILPLRITFRPRGRYLVTSLVLAAGSLIVAFALLYLNFNAISRAGNVSNKYIVYSLVPINVLSGAIGAATDAVSPWFGSRTPKTDPSAVVGTPQDLVVVLAVGESSRQKNFGLYGYTRRDTTPRLARIPELHALNGIATRGSTIDALPRIFEKKGIKLPGLVSGVGIPTSCYVNFSLYDNCAAVGERKPAHCGHGGQCYDEDVLPMLESDLASYRSGSRFIVLHFGGGSHGPVYRDRHPPEFLKFEPTCNDADVANKCTMEQLYNSYDNTILYVDHVVSGAIEALDRSGVPYVFLYLSDHGESLMENGVMFHGMPPGVPLPPEQAHIPLLVKASKPISIVPRAEYGQPDVFDTVVDLLGIRSAMFDRAGSFVRR